MHLNIPLALLGLAALALATTSSTGAATPPVTVTETAYHGWDGAYRLSNGVVELVVVPQIGRIMAFHFAGQPDTDPLWNNPPLLGKPAPTGGTDWANFGGDKLWPSPQSDWPKHAPQAWPPDPAFEFGPFTVSRVANGVRLTGPEVPNYALRVTREITLVPGQARVNLRDTFTKSKDAAGDRNGFPIGIWSVTQTRGDETVYVPLNPQGLFPGVGYTSLGDAGACAELAQCRRSAGGDAQPEGPDQGRRG